MPVVPVRALRAEGGDLHHAPRRDHAYGAVLFSRQHQLFPGEDRFGLLRDGGGADVIVVGLQAKAGVPHAAAHRVGRISGSLQRVQAFQNIRGELHAAFSCLGLGVRLHRSVSAHTAHPKYRIRYPEPDSAAQPR